MAKRNKRSYRFMIAVGLMLLSAIFMINYTYRTPTVFPQIKFAWEDSLKILNFPFAILIYYIYDYIGWVSYLLPILFLMLAITFFQEGGIKHRRLRILLFWGYLEAFFFIFLLNYAGTVMTSVIPDVNAGVVAKTLALYFNKIGGFFIFLILFTYSFIAYLIYLRQSSWHAFFGGLRKGLSEIKNFLQFIVNQCLQYIRNTFQNKDKKQSAGLSGSKTAISSKKDSINTKEGKSKAVTIKDKLKLDLSPVAIDPLKAGDHFNEKTVSANAEGSEEIKEAKKKIATALLSLSIPLEYVSIRESAQMITLEFAFTKSMQHKDIKKKEEDLILKCNLPSLKLLNPIPGKEQVGFMFKRANRGMVEFTTEAFKGIAKESAIPLLLGEDQQGRMMSYDLAACPHLLVAGSTGSGKSVFLSSFVISLLFSEHSEKTRLIIADPKQVEFQIFAKLPNLACPILTETEDIQTMLESLVTVMEKRYEDLMSAECKSIKEYNQKYKSKPMTYLAVIVDEFGDLMMQDRGTAKESIIRLAQKSRAVGIHLILATQRPSAKIIDGLIKANFPARVAFKTVSKLESRIILDDGGAEDLFGKGDMLFKAADIDGMLRLQGIYIDSEAISAILK